MLIRTLLFVLLWNLVCAAVSGQESGVFADPMMPYGQADSGTEPPPSYRLSGTLISPSGRVAIVNGRPSREGDRVDGAEILSIETRAVHLRTGSGELTVTLGSDAVRDRSSGPAATPELSLPTGTAPSQVVTPARFDTHHGPVKPGETLSGIALRYLDEGVTMNQMMIALFEANPRAFSGNINVLYEGAVLRIPDADELRRQVPAVAAAEVTRQQLDWRDRYPHHAKLPEVSGQDSYGPVASGETLSGVAERVLPEGVTMNQMMMALFQANPGAFSGNINVLYEGAVLRVPDGEELRRQVPETATAEVVRQTAAWRADSWRQPGDHSPG